MEDDIELVETKCLKTKAPLVQWKDIPLNEPSNEPKTADESSNEPKTADKPSDKPETVDKKPKQTFFSYRMIKNERFKHIFAECCRCKNKKCNCVSK